MIVTYTRIISEVSVIGWLWQPGYKAAMTYTLSAYDIENIKTDDGTITREAVVLWLDSHSGDFSQIIDFAVTIGDKEFDSTWNDPDSEIDFNDCIFGDTN